MNDLAIGIDIGGTRIKAALTDREGKLYHEVNVPSEMEDGYDHFKTNLSQFVGELVKSGDGLVKGIGMGVAGLMNEDRSIILHAPNCHAIVGHQLAKDLAAATGLMTVMDNDANMMAIGEGVCGSAKGSRFYIAITLGTGVGGAVISDGVLIRGITGGGGELGHIPIARKGPRCGCGSVGCLEAFIGRPGINRFISRNIPEYKGFGLKDLHGFAEKGDERADLVFKYIGKHLGTGLAGLVNIFNPQLVIIGGGVSEAWKFIREDLVRELEARAFKSYVAVLEVKPAELGNSAGIVGAGKLVWDEINKKRAAGWQPV